MSVDVGRTKAVLDAGRIPYRFTADQVLRMSDEEIFGDDDVELWDGVLYKMVKGEIHNAIVGQTADLIRPMMPKGCNLREEKSSRSRQDTLPEPDIAVCRGRIFDYLPLPPPLDKLALIVEVSVSTHRADAGEKMRRYAGAGIPVYWQVDPSTRSVHVRTRPTSADDKPARYAKKKTYTIDQEMPVVIDGREVGRVAVAELFPPQEP